MQIIRQWIQDTLGFSKTEANGTLILTFIVVSIFVVPRLYWKYFSDPKSFTADPKLSAWARELSNATKTTAYQSEESNITISETFSFDPNTASKDELNRLGFSERVVSNLTNYRQKGGSFRIKSDLKKIYGINQSRVDELWKYIQLPEKIISKASPPVIAEKSKEVKTEKKLLPINHATAEDLQNIRGIGPSRSTRIVKFRNLLGGFYDLNQLQEVYGLDSIVIAELTKSVYLDTILIQLNINSDSAHVLSKHPYVSYSVGKALFNYRLQHGPYKSITEIKAIKIIDDSLYQKIYPYLSLKP